MPPFAVPEESGGIVTQLRRPPIFGTSNTMGIIAILIGLVQGDTHQIVVRDVIISGVDAPPRHQREIGQLTLRAWRGYERSALAAAGITTIGRRLMEEEGIFF